MRHFRLTVTAVLAVVGAAGCGSGEVVSDAAPPERVQRLDVVAGTYRGIPLGGDPGHVHRELGPKEAASEDEPATPVRGTSYGPWSIAYGDRACASPVYRYEYVAFGFNCGELLWVETTEPGAATVEGVAIGDPLDSVEAAYPDAVCGTAGGGEYEEYPACSVKIARARFAWFGGNPITTIAIGTVELEGVSVDEPFTGKVFTLQAGDFVTYEPGEAKPGDKVVCQIDGKEIVTHVPPPNTGVSTDPMYVSTKPDGSVRAECGGIHAETAPPGSW